jgi:acetyl esterase/lipase
VPSSVSERAQRALAPSTYGIPAQEEPALDDVEGWLAHVDAGNANVLARFVRDVDDLPVTVETRTIGDVTTFVAIPDGAPAGPDHPVYFDVHGGALILCGGEVCRALAAITALTRGMQTWAPDYRMPPLHPYPTPLDDVVAVYRELTRHWPAERIVVGGASAGGNLAAALVLRARDEGLPLPACLVLLTPELDLTESGDSFETNMGIDNVLTRRLTKANALYAAGHDLTDPYVSPLYGDVSPPFPPTLLQAGTRDLFLSNAVRMHRKLRAAGVDAELHVFEAMPHSGFGGAPEDAELAEEVRRFMDRHVRALTRAQPTGVTPRRTPAGSAATPPHGTSATSSAPTPR